MTRVRTALPMLVAAAACGWAILVAVTPQTGSSAQAGIPPEFGCPKQRPYIPKLKVTLDTRRLVGLSIDQARRLARAHGCSVRLFYVNGKPNDTFLDENWYRVSVAVDRGVVTDIIENR